MSDKNLSQSVLEKIREEHIKPKPKWEFLFKEYFVWSVGVISLIIGSVAIAVIIFMLRYNNWDIYEKIDDSLLGFVILTLPYFWFLFLALFIWLINFNIKHTKHGYKYNVNTILLTSVVASLFFGSALYMIGAGRWIDAVMSENAPFYRHIVNQRINLWEQPSRGLLIGVIYSASSSKENLELLDSTGKIWEVDTSKAVIAPEVKIKAGQAVRLTGNYDSDSNEFDATKIIDIGPGEGCFKNGNLGGCRPPSLQDKNSKPQSKSHDYIISL